MKCDVPFLHQDISFFAICVLLPTYEPGDDHCKRCKTQLLPSLVLSCAHKTQKGEKKGAKGRKGGKRVGSQRVWKGESIAVLGD